MNYSGYDEFNDLVNVCKKCGNKPSINLENGIYKVACMNCTCNNMNYVEDKNFYKVIDKWNKMNRESFNGNTKGT